MILAKTVKGYGMGEAGDAPYAEDQRRGLTPRPLYGTFGAMAESEWKPVRMSRTRKVKAKHPIARNPDELGKLLGLSKGDVALTQHKAELSRIATAAIRDSGLQVNAIVERSGVARSKVSAVKNGATVSVSCDLLIKIIGATGKRIQLKAA